MHIYIPQTDSTNNYLNALGANQHLEEFTVVSTGFQTSGKGQRGNSWESEQGANLLFSIVLYPDFLPANRQFLLSQIISLAIKEALNTVIESISIKWPNDIYWNDRKICGILIENDLMGSAMKKSIVGVGLNVNQREFRSQAPNPVSLWQITGSEHALDSLLTKILQAAQASYAMIKKGNADSIIRQYHQALYRREGYHEYVDKDGLFKAKIEGVLPEGRLVLVDEMGEKRTYAFKEVKAKLPTLSNPL